MTAQIFQAFFKYIPKDFITYLNIKRGTRKQKKSVGAAAYPLHLIIITRRNGAKPAWGKKHQEWTRREGLIM